MRKLLIVDGEAVLRRALVRGMDWASLGCVVVGEADSGEEALAAAEHCRPDLILTDLEPLRLLRERGSGVPAIVLTARRDFETVRAALRLGAADYLLKPLCERELRDAVARVCTQAEAAVGAPEGLPALPAGDKSKYVLRTLAYIAEHYADADINISAIARSISISEGHLSHVFKKETGYTTLGYLTHYRICVARRLLADCRYKVYEVAGLVGYRDVAYFASTFKRLTGLSPSEYRERCR